jgi:hypothetical protein
MKKEGKVEDKEMLLCRWTFFPVMLVMVSDWRCGQIGPGE